MLSFLPEKFQIYIKQFDFDKLYEIRLRVGYSLKLKVGEEQKLITYGQAKCEKEDIDYIIKTVTEHSLYAYNECLKKGFLTTKQGVRIGLAGECVYDNDKIITIKNITSLNIRVPHFIENSADKIYKYVLDQEINSSLIISPPFYGKTTMLKSIVKKLDSEDNYNILVVDERNEFSYIVGANIDSIKFCNKEYAFSYGIRSMSPDVIITDELMGENDWKSVELAINSGVKVIASCHAENLKQLIDKESFISGLFQRYVVLDSHSGRAGIVYKVYNGEFKEI